MKYVFWVTEAKAREKHMITSWIGRLHSEQCTDTRWQIKYTEATRQNGHKNETYGFEEANSLDFPVVSISISFLCYLPSSLNVGKLAPRSPGHGLWHLTLHFRFDDVNHPPSGVTKKRREEREIKRWIGGAGRIGKWTGNEHNWKGEQRGGEWEGMEGGREGTWRSEADRCWHVKLEMEPRDTVTLQAMRQGGEKGRQKHVHM